jgi:Ni,Fe-hydrogenase III small subunit/ferredoxin
MSPWASRGLVNGVVTNLYPRRPPGGIAGLRAGVRPTGVPLVGSEAGSPQASEIEGAEIEAICPTGAISVVSSFASGSAVLLDRGSCILCGRCVQAFPEYFIWDDEVELAKTGRPLLIAGVGEGTSDKQAELAKVIGSGHVGAPRSPGNAALRRRLRQSVAVRHIDTGSDGAEEWEIHALMNPFYDVQRFGIIFTASPRHADVLLVTGCGAPGMTEPLRSTFEAMPEPKAVVAVGTDAISGGLFGSGVGDLVPVDIWVPGSPPCPISILHGILLAMGRRSQVRASREASGVRDDQSASHEGAAQ